MARGKQEGAGVCTAAARSPEWVGSYEELGAVLGPHRASFPRFRRDYPDAPVPKGNGRHPVAAWRKFFERHPECLAKSQAAAGVAGIEALPGSRRALIEIEQHRKLKLANDQKERTLVSRSELATALRTLGETQKGLVRQKLENEYPALVEALGPEQRAELRKKGKELADEICKRMQRLVDRWVI